MLSIVNGPEAEHTHPLRDPVSCIGNANDVHPKQLAQTPRKPAPARFD